MRIAQVTNLYESVPPKDQHGLERVVYDLTEELVKMGHEVTLFATADSKTSAKLVPIWPMATSKDPYGKLMDEQTYAMWSVSEAFIRHKDFDVIHSHVGYVASHFAGAIDVPVVSTIHNPISYDFYNKFPTNHLSYFENIQENHFRKSHSVTVSQFQSKILRRSSQVIYNGLPIELFSVNESPSDYLAFLGYITPDKGAAEAIQSVIPTGMKLKIAGPLDDQEINQKYFSEKIKPFLNDKIEYVGPLGFDEKVEFLKNAKATLMPIQWDEPFGLVAIESMACGTPVIAWNRAAMPEIIIGGVTGFLVNSVAEMTDKIYKISDLKRSDCRRRVEENFSARKMAENYVALYEKLIQNAKIKM